MPRRHRRNEREIRMKSVSRWPNLGPRPKRLVPELQNVPSLYLTEPEKMRERIQKESGCIIGKDYPEPIVNHHLAVAEARKKMSRVRRTQGARTEASEIKTKHGSRRKSNRISNKKNS